MFFFPVIGCLSRNSKMSISYFKLLSIFTFSTSGNISAELTSSSAHLFVSLRTDSSSFHSGPLLIKKHSVCLCFADRDVCFFLKCGCSLWARLTVYKINAALAFRSFLLTSDEMSTRMCMRSLLHGTFAAASTYDSRSDVQNTQGRAGSWSELTWTSACKSMFHTSLQTSEAL